MRGKSLLLSGAAILLALGIHAQDCNGYYFLQNNKTIEMAILNKKGDQNAKQVYTVSNVTNAGSATVADLESEMFDKKGKSIVKSKAKIKCEGGVMMIDMKMSMPQQPGMSAETNVQGEDIFIEYPNNMNVGDNLKNAIMHLE